MASLLEVGTGFHPELTGRENIYLNGAILGMKRAEIERKFDEIVAFSEIEKFIDTPVKRYSSGMYVRLAFAVAAHLEPEILLVDEVLAVGDAAFQKKCLETMRDVTQEGRTVLFVSHNLAAIAEITQQSIWIDAGELVMYENTKDVVSSYLQKTLYGAIDSGYHDLASETGVEDTPRKVRATWVRLVDDEGEQTTIFTEEKPISIELGISVQSRYPASRWDAGSFEWTETLNFSLCPQRRSSPIFCLGST